MWKQWIYQTRDTPPFATKIQLKLPVVNTFSYEQLCHFLMHEYTHCDMRKSCACRSKIYKGHSTQAHNVNRKIHKDSTRYRIAGGGGGQNIRGSAIFSQFVGLIFSWLLLASFPVNSARLLLNHEHHKYLAPRIYSKSVTNTIAASSRFLWLLWPRCLYHSILINACF